MSAPKKESMASLVIVLAVICLVIAGLLGLVNSVTEGPIHQQMEETVKDSIAQVLPSESEPEEIEYTDNEAVKAVFKIGEEGYAVEVNSPNGFGGAVDMMTGINANGEVTGIAIISHSETSGLGSKATDPEWQAQFKGVTGEAKVTKDGGSINAITGSTITSRAVCDGVNIAFDVVNAMG